LRELWKDFSQEEKSTVFFRLHFDRTARTFLVFIQEHFTIQQAGKRNSPIPSSAYPGKTIYTCSITGALQSYPWNNHVIDLYFTVPTAVEPGSLLLFNYPEFSNHFAASNPMLDGILLSAITICKP
jgi:hypothetical protein